MGRSPGATEAFKRLAHNWLNLCKPATYALTRLLVQHFQTPPKLYVIHGDLWSQLRLTSMHLSRDGTFKLWFQFNFQSHWEERYVAVEVRSLSVTRIQVESGTYGAKREVD